SPPSRMSMMMIWPSATQNSGAVRNSIGSSVSATDGKARGDAASRFDLPGATVEMHGPHTEEREGPTHDLDQPEEGSIKGLARLALRIMALRALPDLPEADASY